MDDLRSTPRALHWTAQSSWPEIEPGVFRGELDASWGQGRALFGGLVAGGLLRSMAVEVASERRLRSLQATFVSPTSPGTVEARVRVLRAGGSATTVAGEVVQDGQIRCIAQAAFGLERPSAYGVSPPPRPQVDAPESRMVFPYLEGITPRFTQHFDYRWTQDHFPFTGGPEAVVQGWVRHRGGEVSVDEVAVLGLLDAWPAPFLTITERPIPASTVTWQVQLMADLDGLARPEDWFLYEARTTASGGGYSDFSASLWHQDGVLVAHSRQLVAEFSARG